MNLRAALALAAALWGGVFSLPTSAQDTQTCAAQFTSARDAFPKLAFLGTPVGTGAACSFDPDRGPWGRFATPTVWRLEGGTLFAETLFDIDPNRPPKIRLSLEIAQTSDQDVLATVQAFDTSLQGDQPFAQMQAKIAGLDMSSASGLKATKQTALTKVLETVYILGDETVSPSLRGQPTKRSDAVFLGFPVFVLENVGRGMLVPGAQDAMVQYLAARADGDGQLTVRAAVEQGLSLYAFLSYALFGEMPPEDMIPAMRAIRISADWLPNG